MQLLRLSEARGSSRHDGVDTRHAFSSGDFHDPQWMGWGALRVANDEWLAPGAVVAAHRYANMEVASVLVSGAIGYENDLDTGLLQAGDMHLLSAGSGITHRIANASADEPAHLIRLWLQPGRVNAAPRSEAILRATQDRAHLIAAATFVDANVDVALRSGAWLRSARITRDDAFACTLLSSRRYWLQVLTGSVDVAGTALGVGDAMGFADIADTLQIAPAKGVRSADVLLLDLAG